MVEYRRARYFGDIRQFAGHIVVFDLAQNPVDRELVAAVPERRGVSERHLVGALRDLYRGSAR